MAARRALIASILLTAPAHADADVGVVIVPAASAPASPSELTEALEAALTEGELVVRADPIGAARAALRDGAVPAQALDTFARVEALIDEGWRAYLEVQTEFAVSRLGEARRQAEELLPLEGGAIAYAEAALRLGAALDNAGRHDEADEVLRLAAALDPARAVTMQEFSPDVVAAWERAIGATVAKRAVTIPSGVHVEIDGEGTMTELTIGQHTVVARAAGKRARGFTVSIPAGEGAHPLAIELDDDPAALGLADGPAAGQSEPEAARWVDAVLRYGELDGVVIASSIWRGRRPALLVQWCDGEPVTCTAVVELGYDDASALSAAARAAVDEALAARDGRRYGVTLPGDARVAVSSAPVTGGKRCRWCRPALYISAGVVAIAATAIAFALAADDERVTSVGINPDDFTQ